MQRTETQLKVAQDKRELIVTLKEVQWWSIFEAQLASVAQKTLIRLCCTYLFIFFYCIEASVLLGKMAANSSRFTSFWITSPVEKKMLLSTVAAKFQYGICDQPLLPVEWNN